MARPLRLEFPGALYHITARGNAKQKIFLDDNDREKFLSLLGQEVRQQRWECYSYCLMGNHYHIVIETPEGNLISGVRRLNGVYSQWFNRRHGRVGHLFQGRYKSIIVDKEDYLPELCRYTALNPVRAGIVDRPDDWRWSIYRATMGIVDKPKWLNTEWILEHFGGDNEHRRRAFEEFVAEGVNVPSLWEQLRGQIWLGSETYLEKMEKLIRADRVEEVPLAQTKPTRPTEVDILRCVADYYGLTVGELVSRSDQNAYRTAVYLLRRVANVKLRLVARQFNVSLSRISRIQSDVEMGYVRDSKFPELFKRYKIQDRPRGCSGLRLAMTVRRESGSESLH